MTGWIILYNLLEAMVCSPNGDTNFLDIATGVLQGDTLALFLFIICRDYVLWMSVDLMKENGFMLKTRSRWYFTEIINDADYAHSLALLANTPTQAESLLHSLEQAAWGITLCELS